MQRETFTAIINSIRAGHTAALAAGGVARPTLFCFVGGQPAAMVTLRPVYPGADAASAIGGMSSMAAAAGADEIVAAWETQDLAIACEHPPLHPGSALTVVWAARNTHAVYRFPYIERSVGRTPDGLHKVAPDWQKPTLGEPGGVLEPAIRSLVEFSFQPLDLDVDDPLAAAQSYLTEQGYSVRLFQPHKQP